MALRLKRGVKLNGVQPELVLGIMVAETVLNDEGYDLTVTSLLDGTHSAGSLHYAGFAFDLRTWADDAGTQMDDNEKQIIAEKLRNALGDEFDVVVESTHIHVEFDVRAISE